MVRCLLFLIVLLSCHSSLISQTIEIPDVKFLYALIDEGIDVNGDNKISYAEAEVIDSLDISNKEIHDLTGIEAFTNLEDLNCNMNYLKNMDVSRNANLKELRCDFNGLSSLDISKNIGLELLSCEVNPLRSLDVSNNSGLKILGCLDTNLESLDLSNNQSLVGLRCNFNPLSHLDVSKNPALRYLECFCTGLHSLDVTHNRALAYLGCSFNQLSSLDVSKNDSLQKLYCDYNQLITLDISNNTVLKVLSIPGMPSLKEICVRTLPFPYEGVEVISYDSYNVHYKDCKAPDIFLSDEQYNQGSINVTSSEDGMIYLVPEDTECDLTAISDNCFDSVAVLANSPVIISINGIEDGDYWLIARDIACNLSDPISISIEGLGINPYHTEQVNIYPNPVRDMITIRTGISDKYSVKITALNGRLIHKSVFEGVAHQIDLNALKEGIYLVKIRSANHSLTEKIIKFQ